MVGITGDNIGVTWLKALGKMGAGGDRPWVVGSLRSQVRMRGKTVLN